MAHVSEDHNRLRLKTVEVSNTVQLENIDRGKAGVYLFWFPFGRTSVDASAAKDWFKALARFCSQLSEASTICILTTPPDAAALLPHLADFLKVQHWIAVKTTDNAYTKVRGELPRRHAALLIFTRYNRPLRHTITRIEYTYCPACGKTTKDYGGKMHVYHQRGTSISDVWRDIDCNPEKEINAVTDRLRDLFGLEPYSELILLDLRKCTSILSRRVPQSHSPISHSDVHLNGSRKRLQSRLIHGDCLKVLRTIPDNSIDFCFADLPYNLKKKYCRWKDDLEIVRYFQWCDKWLAELCRVLKPGRTLAVLNIPLWAARHFDHLSSLMEFQSWVVWDALSFPVRKIMPVHYSIICFSKGAPRQLPGLSDEHVREDERAYISPKGELFCIRPHCMSRRDEKAISDRTAISDTWHDVFRLTHNSRRVSHPCQLPPLLMRRLYALFTTKGEMILDCFNGAGTSTLVAQQMRREFVGIEISKRYHNLAAKRHEQLRNGENPFDNGMQIPNAKNSSVRRLPKQKYKVSKKILQLEIKQIAEELGRLPRRDDVLIRSKYPIEYFDQYFVSWSEVCAAARAIGIAGHPVKR